MDWTHTAHSAFVPEACIFGPAIGIAVALRRDRPLQFLGPTILLLAWPLGAVFALVGGDVRASVFALPLIPIGLALMVYTLIARLVDPGDPRLRLVPKHGRTWPPRIPALVLVAGWGAFMISLVFKWK